MDFRIDHLLRLRGRIELARSPPKMSGKMITLAEKRQQQREKRAEALFPDQ
jgi:hypothetical protein